MAENSALQNALIQFLDIDDNHVREIPNTLDPNILKLLHLHYYTRNVSCVVGRADIETLVNNHNELYRQVDDDELYAAAISKSDDLVLIFSKDLIPSKSWYKIRYAFLIPEDEVDSNSWKDWLDTESKAIDEWKSASHDYWSKYDESADESNDQKKNEDVRDDDDDRYYSRYNQVETAIGDSSRHQPSQTHLKMTKYIHKTIFNLSELAESMEMSPSEFQDAIISALDNLK